MYDARDTHVYTHPSGRSLSTCNPPFHRSLSTYIGLFSHTQVSFVHANGARDTHIPRVGLFAHV